MKTKTILTCTPKPRQFKLRNIVTGEIESFTNIRQTAKKLGVIPENLSILLAGKAIALKNYVLPDRDTTVYKLLKEGKEILALKAKKTLFRADVIRLSEKTLDLIKNSPPNSYNGVTYISETHYKAVKVNRLPKPSRIKSQVPKAKSFRIKNILTGEITSHKSVNKFALENGLKTPSLFHVLDKSRKSAGNYCHPNTKVEFLDIYNLATKKWEKNCNLQLKGYKCLKSGLKKLKSKGRYKNWITIDYIKRHEYDIDLPIKTF